MKIALRRNALKLELVPEDFADEFVRYILDVYFNSCVTTHWSERQGKLVQIRQTPDVHTFIFPSARYYLIGVLSREACAPGELEAVIKHPSTKSITQDDELYELLQNYARDHFHNYRDQFFHDVMRVLNVYQLVYIRKYRQNRDWSHAENVLSTEVVNNPTIEVW